VGTASATINRVTEGNTTTNMKFYLSRTGSTTAALNVNYSLQGTATPGTDFTVTTNGTLTFNNGTRSGTLTIPAGASGASVNLSVASTNDLAVEGVETIILQLEAGSYSKTPVATIYIDDNDATTQNVAFTSNGASGPESQAAVNVPVTLAAPSSGTTTVDYYVDSGSRSSVSSTTAAPTLPYWTRVVRAGNALTSYISSDGVIWQPVGTTQTISMSSTSYTAGLVAMSSTSGVSCTATLDNVSITGLDEGGTSGAAVFGGVGTTNPASTSSVAGGVYTLNAGGAGLSLTSTSDTSCYVSFAITNSADCTITARVTGITNGNNTSRAGVMRLSPHGHGGGKGGHGTHDPPKLNLRQRHLHHDDHPPSLLGAAAAHRLGVQCLGLARWQHLDSNRLKSNDPDGAGRAGRAGSLRSVRRTAEHRCF
jgi:hypothetical protein